MQSASAGRQASVSTSLCVSVCARYKIIHSTSTLVCFVVRCSGEHCSPLLDCAVSASAADQASVSRLAEWSCAWPASCSGVDIFALEWIFLPRGEYLLLVTKSRGGYI